MISTGVIQWAGNHKLKIFGELYCKSGKRMHKQNRIFFGSREEAVRNGFRPCAHCMSLAYQAWKNEFI
nr:Ada metal-binding domain-containing protein [Catalinimonas alkaloidigena]